MELSKITRYAIQNDFGKVKAKDGEVNLNLDNALDVQKKNIQINSQKDSLNGKRSFWEKMFGK